MLNPLGIPHFVRNDNINYFITEEAAIRIQIIIKDYFGRIAASSY
jgi:hypothetical protein